MYTADKQDKFVELRAQGWSLNHIAAEIYVAKRTLVEWSRELAAEIQNLRAQLQEMAQEKFLTSHEDELARLHRMQKDVEDELANRTLHSVPVDKLFRVAAELREEIRKLRAENESAEQASKRESNGYSRGIAPATNGSLGH